VDYGFLGLVGTAIDELDDCLVGVAIGLCKLVGSGGFDRLLKCAHFYVLLGSVGGSSTNQTPTTLLPLTKRFIL
jgi:hypothetical protein